MRNRGSMLTHPWFLLGTMAPLGCVIGYALGTAIDPKSIQKVKTSFVVEIP